MLPDVVFILSLACGYFLLVPYAGLRRSCDLDRVVILNDAGVFGRSDVATVHEFHVDAAGLLRCTALRVAGPVGVAYFGDGLAHCVCRASPTLHVRGG